MVWPFMKEGMEPEESHNLSEEIFKTPPIFFVRYRLYFFLILCFFFPLCLVAFYAHAVAGIFVVATLAGLLGMVSAWYILKEWRERMFHAANALIRAKLVQISHTFPEQIAEVTRLRAGFEKEREDYEYQIDLLHTAVAKSKEEVCQLHRSMDKKLEEMRLAYHEFEDMRREYQRIAQELVAIKEEKKEALKQQEAVGREYHKTITEQRMVIEKKQRYIGKLEGKVRDLMYEIRNLLQLDTPLQQEPLDDRKGSNSSYDLTVQLQKYIERAETMTGVDHIGYLEGGSPRFLSPGSYAVDLRRLFESFREEAAAIIFLYSSQENRFLFVNDCVKTTLGWGPEKFMKEFAHLVCKGYPEWKSGLARLSSSRKQFTSLHILNRSGEARPFQCYMGVIAKGPFSGHILGLLTSNSGYPS